MKTQNKNVSSSELNWATLLSTTTRYVTEKVKRLRWRGSLGGVLPEGHDGKSIASQAIADLLKTLQNGKDRFHPVPNFSPTHQCVQGELYRRVNRHIDRLYHRKERLLIRNEPDLAMVLTDEGDYIPYIETIPDVAPSPASALVQLEKDAEFSRFETDFQRSLGPDRRLIQTFETIRDGIHQPRQLARRLGLRPHTINNLQKRLRRKAAKFCKTNPLPGE